MNHLFTIFLLFLINLHLSHQEDKLLVQRVKTTVNTISLQWQAPKKIAITSGLRPPQMMVYHYQLSDGSEPLNSHNIPWSSKGVKIGLSSDQSTGSAIIENLRPNSKYLIKVEDDKMNETLIVETKDGCFHNSSVYSVGDKFNISCDQICVCQSNSTLTCKDRCQHKPNSASDGCSEKPDPKDPQCCVIHQCEDDKITVIRPKVLITGRTKTSVQIAWDDFKLPNYESGYVIEYKSLNVTSNSTVNDTTTTVSDDWIQIQGNNTPFWTISGLKPNSSYAIRIGLWEDPSERSKIVDSGRSEIITAQTEDGCLRGNISYALRKEIIEGCESRCICMGGDRWNCLPVCADPLIDKGTNKDPTCTEIAVDDCCSTVTCIESRNEPISPNGAGPNDLTFSDKPGNCYEPVNIRSETGICLEECQHDYHCRGLDKCCPTSCGGSVCSQTNTGSASKKCESIVCGQNALCIESRNSSELPKCACKPGYRGDPNDLTNGCRKANSRSNLVCEYKNVTYGPGEEFFDGCAFKCICSEALEIECNPRCPFMTPMDSITTVDPLCTVIQDPKDPCCKMVACESKSVETISVNSTTTMMLTLSSSLANETGFIGETSSVNSPLSIDGCRHDNITYQAGESFVSGCESRCICKEGGHLQCKPRCPVFQGYNQKFCRLIPDPDDPECCKIAVCDTSSLSTSSPSSASTPSMLNSKKIEPFDLILDSAKVLNATFMTLRLIIPNSVHHKAKHIFNVRYSKVNMESLSSTEPSQQRSWSSFQAGEDDLRLLEPGMFEIDFNGLEPSTEYYVEINEENSNSTSNRVFIKTFPVGVDSSFNGCFFNNQIIQVGAEFYDGCEYKCICREGGTRECEDRCPVYIDTIGFEECEWSPSPDDPCCTIPVCNKPKETSKDMGSSDSDNDTADPSASSSSTSSSAPVEPFCLGKDDRLHFIGEAWDESGPGGCLKQTCRCVQLANKTTTIRCHGGCAPIPPNAMKATTDCPKPHLVQPDDPCLCPYVICDHGEGDEPNSNPQSSSGQTSGSKLSSPSTSPPHMVIRPPLGSTSDLTPGFCRFNGQTVPKGKFNDGCRAICECLPSGKVECGPLNCPNLFETPTEECLEWELDPNFIPEPPNCCPRPTCKNDGSCIFAGLRFPNFKPIPTELLPCGTRCVCMNSNVTCENRCPPISDIPPPNLPCPPPLAYRGHLPNDDCCLHWMCRDFERSAFCVQNGNRYKIGEQWEDANPINVLGPRRRCQCKPTPPLGKPQVECFPGICPKITERHLKPSPECPLPVLISPEDPILCPYVICNYSEETGKELESVSVVAMNNSAVRVRFTLPSLFVGLIGHAELYYTSDPTLPRHQWNVQKFARPKRLFDTANIEYHLGNLRPDTTYYFQVRILIEALHSGPESQVYKLYLPGPKSTTSGSQGFPLTATTVSLSQPSSSTLPPQIDMNVNLNAVPIDGNSIRLTWRKLDSHEKSLVDGITIKYRARDEIASDKWLTTPMIHRDVNEYTLRDLRPGMAYTVDLILKPVDGLPTQLITVRPVTVEIPSRPQDEYDFNPSIEVAPESYRTMMKLQGVPRPTDKYVNVVKVNFREANSEGLANKMVHMFKTPSEDGTIMVDGLSPNNRYKAWVDLYLANGNTVSTNTVTFTTKEDLKPPAIHDNRDNDPSANEAEALKESSSGEAIRPYYIALMIVAIFAIVTGIGFVTLLCVLMKTKTCAKAAITRAPSEAAYDNPTYKTYDGEKPGDEPVKNGST